MIAAEKNRALGRAARTRGTVSRTPRRRPGAAVSRLRGERVRHDGVEWTLFDPDRLRPELFFGTWCVLAVFDDRVTVLESLGTGIARSIQHAAMVRAARWRSMVDGQVRIGVADPAQFVPRWRTGVVR